MLVDNNTVSAVSGVDVLDKPKTQERLAKATAQPDPSAEPTLTERVQDAVVQKAQDKAVGSAQKAVDSKLNSLLESAQ
ncbi:hypothetical protein D3C76_1687380 [compost metagenome]